MARSASERLRVTLVAAAMLAVPMGACRLFVDLDGLREEPKPDASGADVVAPEVDATSDDDSAHPDPLEGGQIIDASNDIPVFDVDASKTCPAGKGPDMVRIPTSTSSFCIDTTEVTRGQYDAFLQTNPSTASQGAFCAWNTTYVPTADYPVKAGDESLPVGAIDYCDAVAFCTWSGKHLCGRIGGGTLTFASAQTIDAEWVFACSGAGTRSYPYGNVYDKNTCNGGETDPYVGLEPVKTRTKCEVSGVYDLAGNTHEWIDSCVVLGDPATDPCVIQDSAYDGHPQSDMICTKMGTGARNTTHPAIGFRCCAD